MEFPHEKRESEEYGRSPGNGITPMPLSQDPLATEGEATPGPDDVNPYEENEREYGLNEDEIAQQRDPTAGNDPYSFDDVAPAKPDIGFDSEPEGILEDNEGWF